MTQPSREELLASERLERMHAYVLHHYAGAVTGHDRTKFERDLASMVAGLQADLRSSAQALPSEPVAWRWRHPVWFPVVWQYRTEQILEHDPQLIIEPLFAALPASSGEVRDYTAWLVEMAEPTGPLYFQLDDENGDDWTKDHDKALHFSRQSDAARIIEYYGWTRVKAIEHCWPALKSSPSVAVQPLEET